MKMVWFIRWRLCVVQDDDAMWANISIRLVVINLCV